MEGRPGMKNPGQFRKKATTAARRNGAEKHKEHMIKTRACHLNLVHKQEIKPECAFNTPTLCSCSNPYNSYLSQPPTPFVVATSTSWSVVVVMVVGVQVQRLRGLLGDALPVPWFNKKQQLCKKFFLNRIFYLHYFECEA